MTDLRFTNRPQLPANDVSSSEAQYGITVSSLLPATLSHPDVRSRTYVGIDFGTTNTVVSIASMDEQQNIIKADTLSLRQRLPDNSFYTSEMIPTVIAWLGRKPVLVGEGASREKYKLERGKNIWYSFKMELGEDLGPKYYNSELGDVPPFFIKNPKDATRVFFLYLKSLIDVECNKRGLSKDIKYAVSIPASFEANQRKDLLEALASNSMQVSKQALIDEPNAAFISYAVSRASEGNPMFVSPDYNSKVLVFDFGGGTCDISILEIGLDAKGFFSKNLAISKFTALGGDSIDKYLTYHFLMPRFLKENGKEMDLFRTGEKIHIASALYKVAERLKIRINQSLALSMEDFVMDPQKCKSKTPIKVNSGVTIATSKGTLSGSEFYLTCSELTQAMDVFTRNDYKKTTECKEETYNSIYTPIESAIQKAHINKSEIDYVLLIGGSAQSPYIQSSLKRYFSDSDMLIPRNLQTHVSIGAAIHSLLFNGMNKNLIQPITSEPLLIITKDATPKTILPAGTQIPSDTITINDLVTSRDGQGAVELPICIGNEDKLLFNLKIESASPSGFPANSPIVLTIDVNSDKMLNAVATCMGVSCQIEPLSPFANRELTTEERIALKAERREYIDAAANGGRHTRQGLITLQEQYTKAGFYLKAAETFELRYELYPGQTSSQRADDLNGIGVLYHSAGDNTKAIMFYRRALEENPNHLYANANLGSDLRTINPAEAKEHLLKALSIDPLNDIALIELGHIQKAEGDIESAMENFQKAYDIFDRQWKSNSLQEYAYGWFACLADELGKSDVAWEIRKLSAAQRESYYNVDNLSITKTSTNKPISEF